MASIELIVWPWSLFKIYCEKIHNRIRHDESDSYDILFQFSINETNTHIANERTNERTYKQQNKKSTK